MIILNISDNRCIMAAVVKNDGELSEAAKQFEWLTGGKIDTHDLQPQQMPNGTVTQIMVCGD